MPVAQNLTQLATKIVMALSRALIVQMDSFVCNAAWKLVHVSSSKGPVSHVTPTRIDEQVGLLEHSSKIIF